MRLTQILSHTQLSTITLKWLQEIYDWPGLKSIARVKSKRMIGETESEEIRYFISSCKPSAEKIMYAIRQHWAIENALHWTLDVTCKEDMSRIRKGNAPQNVATIRHIALNMIQKYKKKSKMSLRRIIKNAGWDNLFLHNIIKQNF